MGLTDICVKRPVFAFMLILFLVVMGAFSFWDLGVDLFPRSDIPTVYVRVALPGASPEELTSQVIMPLEQAVSSVSGIDEMRSLASEGSGFISINFVLDKDISEAVEDVREKVNGALRQLPPNMLPPVVAKADPDRDEVIKIAVVGDRSVRELTEIADKQVSRALATVNGVATIDISGGRKRQINVLLDLDKLSSYNLTAQDVERAIRAENVELPGGRITKGPSEVGVRTLGRVSQIEQFNNIIVKNIAGAPVRLKDLGVVEDDMAERRSFAYYQRQPAVVLDVRRQTGTNTVKVVEDVKKRLESLRQEVPPGVRLEVIKDQATYIKASVAALEEHLLLGSLFASLIVWVFIRNFRTVIISAIAIPTSIITTFAFMRWMDFSLNSMTLLGLTLAVGIVIDDAIIVLENIYRFIEDKGIPPMRAAIEATREISLAVVATTISLVIIFVPIAFITGYAQRFLYQFGFTMAIAVMVSMLVAFTLTPTLSARILKRRTNGKGKAPGHAEHSPTLFDKGYLKILDWSLNHRAIIAGVCGLVFVSSYFLYHAIGHDWMPQEDQNELGIWIEMPEGTSLAATEKVTLEMASKIEKIPGVTTVIPQSSRFLDRVTMAFITVLLEDSDRRPDIQTMGAEVRKVLREYAYARPRVTFPNALGGRETFSPIRAQLLGPDMAVLTELARKVSSEFLALPSVSDAKVSLNLANPELQVTIDRQRASDLGVQTADIARAVRLLMSGEDEISTFKEGSEQYPVTMRLLPEQRNNPEMLSRLLVPSARLGMIRLDSVATLQRGLGPSMIERLNRQFSIGMFGNAAQGYSLKQAAEDTAALQKKIGFPPGYMMRFSGQVKILEETTTNMLLAISLASIFMYMVLAAQFESLAHPFIILLTLPLSIPFALLSLMATGRSLNLFSALGILLLLGIVKKNGILQIDYMNRLRDQGMPLRQAILEANRVRLRPILMTTFSIVAGLIPTAVGIGAGASQRSAIAVTIIGGQTLCLLLTLLVVPVGYSVLEDIKGWLARRKVAAEVEAPAAGD